MEPKMAFGGAGGDSKGGKRQQIPDSGKMGK